MLLGAVDVLPSACIVKRLKLTPESRHLKQFSSWYATRLTFFGLYEYRMTLYILFLKLSCLVEDHVPGNTSYTAGQANE